MAEWTAGYVNDLPDSAFAVVESGGEKDADGRTTPRSKRHFPHHDASGKVDLPHLRNALARAPQSPFGDQAAGHLRAHARALDVGEKSMNEDDLDVVGTTGWKSSPASRFELDGAKEGDVLVAFATADGTTVDRDGHITDPGAFPSKKVPVSAYGHSSWPEKGAKLPVGLVEIGEEDGEALAKGRFLVETTHGLDTYRTVKALGELQEWSYGYRIVAATKEKAAAGKMLLRLKSLDVRELSPTLVGAGIGTRTVAIKGDDSGPLAGLPYAEDFDRVLVDVEGIVARSKSLRDLRVKEGRELSETNRARLLRLRDAFSELEETRAELEELIARTDRSDPDAKALGLRLFAEYQATEAALAGVVVTIGG